MDPIYIPQLLQLPDRTIHLSLNERLPDLDTLTPVRGWLAVEHCRTFLQVSAKAETIVTLTCDRTLQRYNHRLLVDTREIVWLSSAEQAPAEATAREVELSLEDLTENLPPDGYFEPGRWLYEQFCLAMPLHQVSEESIGVDCNYTDRLPTGGDSRWSALAAFRDRLARDE